MNFFRRLFAIEMPPESDEFSICPTCGHKRRVGVYRQGRLYSRTDEAVSEYLQDPDLDAQWLATALGEKRS